MISKVGTSPSLLRPVGRQTQRSNEPCTNPEEYFRRSVAIPFLDHLLQGINSR